MRMLSFGHTYAIPLPCSYLSGLVAQVLKLTEEPEDVSGAARGLSVVTDELGDAKEAQRIRTQYRI